MMPRRPSVTKKACVKEHGAETNMWCNNYCCQLSWGNALDEPHGNAVAVPERLRRRADFLRAAKGKRFHARGLTLQAAPRPFSSKTASAGMQGNSTLSARFNATSAGATSRMEAPPRFGFTVTKQSGGAVRRNRIRRRLKEALRLLKPLPARPGHDYVILARPGGACMSFRALQAELMRALGKIDTRQKPSANSSGSWPQRSRPRWRGRGTPKEFKRQDTQGMNQGNQEHHSRDLSVDPRRPWLGNILCRPQLEKERQLQAQMHHGQTPGAQHGRAAGGQFTNPQRAPAPWGRARNRCRKKPATKPWRTALGLNSMRPPSMDRLR